VHSVRPQGDSAEEAPVSRALLRVGLGAFLAMNVMAFSLSFYGMELYGPERQAQALSAGDRALAEMFTWLLLLLTTCVMLLLGVPMAANAVAHLRRGRMAMSTLIVVAASAAYGVSVLSTVRGQGPVYFDSACMVLLLVTIGQYLEGSVKARALGLAGKRLADLPARATVENGCGSLREVAIEDVREGETVYVRAGESVPVDGAVTDGQGSVDEATLTGEAMPRLVRPGERIWAGTTLREGFVRVQAMACGEDRRVAQMMRMLADMMSAGGGLKFQRTADRLASVFVPGTIVIALAAAGWAWRSEGDVAEALSRALSVTLIACPCALGLTAPLITWHAAKRLAGRGIILRSGAALEAAGEMKVIAFDKTGTLTSGDFRVVDVEVRSPEMNKDEVLRFAAGLEAGSDHPIARAIRSAVASPATAQRLEPIPGMGVRGIIDGEAWTVGRAGTVAGSERGNATTAGHEVFLWRDAQVAASLLMSEAERPGAEVALERLRGMGISMNVLTGDNSSAAVEVCRRLRLDAKTGLLPDEKRAAVAGMRARGMSAVGFVGDGVNDALALAEADVGIAMAGASDLSRSSGGVLLIREGLEPVVEFVEAAHDVRRRIRRSLTWALMFNVTGVGLASLGMLSPVFAAGAMIASSLFLIRIAVRDDGVREEAARPIATADAPRGECLPGAIVAKGAA